MTNGEYEELEQHEYWSVRLYHGSCSSCGQTFNDPSAQLVHRPCFAMTKWMKKPSELSQADLNVNPASHLFQCQFCGLRFPGLQNLKQHIRFHLLRRYHCNVCDFLTFTPYEVKKHHESHHSDIPPLEVDRPVEYHVTQSSSTVNRHQSSVALPVDDFFSSPSNNNSLSIPSNNKSLSIPSSNNSLSVMSSPSSSIVRRENTEDLQSMYSTKTFSETCPDCFALFPDEASFHVHYPCIVNKTENNRFICSFCSKTFSEAWSLRMHLENHCTKKYSCNTCSFACHHLNDIHRHVRNHLSLSHLSYQCTFPGCNVITNDFKSRKEHFISTHSMTDVSRTERSATITPSATAANTNITPRIPGIPSGVRRDSPVNRVFNASGSKPPGEKPTIETVDHFWYMIPTKNRCNTCNRNFEDPSQHLCHEPCFKHTKFFDRKNREKPYACPLCRGPHPKPSKLRLHLYSHFPNKFVCKVCGHKGTNPRYIREHVMIHSKDYKPSNGASNGTSLTAISMNNAQRQLPPRDSSGKWISKEVTPRVNQYLNSTPNTGKVVSKEPSSSNGVNNRVNRVVIKQKIQKKATGNDFDAGATEVGVKMLDFGTFVPPTPNVFNFVQV